MGGARSHAPPPDFASHGGPVPRGRGAVEPVSRRDAVRRAQWLRGAEVSTRTPTRNGPQCSRLTTENAVSAHFRWHRAPNREHWKNCGTHPFPRAYGQYRIRKVFPRLSAILKVRSGGLMSSPVASVSTPA